MTAIDPDDIRVGDTVQLTLVREPFVVEAIHDNLIIPSGANGIGKESLNIAVKHTWELIDRPIPKPADGSKWKPSNGSGDRWIYSSNSDMMIIWRADHRGMALLGETEPLTTFRDGYLIPDTDE